MDKQIKDHLERQLDQAESKFANARTALWDAQNRLYDAREAQYLSILEERGITVGSKVSVDGKFYGFSGFGKSLRRRETPEPKFTKLKSDGTPGKQNITVVFARLNNIQPA